MKEEQNEKRPDQSTEVDDSRRDFFKLSALGGLTLASGAALTGCDPADPTVSDSGTGPQSSTDDELLEANWAAPAEIDFTEPIGDGTTPLSMNPYEKGGLKEVINSLDYYQSIKVNPDVPFSHVPYSLVVDDNVSGKTPGGSTVLYGYNGTVPGPTFIVRGNQDLEILLWNHLSGNDGHWAHTSGTREVKTNDRVGKDKADWQISGHVYGPHQQNVTNLHTHGLHISPGVFKETHEQTAKEVQSDNVLLRVVPIEDYYNRVKRPGADGPPMLNNEVVGFSRYKFRLPRPNGKPHYPGTHWYHPHPHGATFDQVAGGMAGFLIVKGDIDVNLATHFKKQRYRELPLLIQRVMGPQPSPGAEVDPDPIKGDEVKENTVTNLANGKIIGLNCSIPTHVVQANQVIRLRVLNGSVDGKGYIRFLIKKGTEAPAFINPNESMYSSYRPGGIDVKNASASAKRWIPKESKDGAIPLLNIAYDGINLMDANGNHDAMAVEWLTIGVANRADFLVTVPNNAIKGDVYTIWGQQMVEAVDSEGGLAWQDNKGLNLRIARFRVGSDDKLPEPDTEEGVLQYDWAAEGPVDEILMPVTDDEITIKDNEEQTSAYLPDNPTNLNGDPITLKKKGNAGTAIRARRVVYSGWGDAGVDGAAYSPTISFPPTVKELYNSMLIDGQKYGADTPHHEGWDKAEQRMQLNTAEEWTLYNYSMTTYLIDYTKSNTEDNFIFGIPTYKNANGSSIPGLGANSREVTKAVHHPFHIHQNAFYVKSIQDPDGNELLPIDDEGKPIPRWQDTVYIPHNGGRVIFRSRFMDYVGKYVNHCHLLQHEDWGMMQAVEVLKKPASTETDAEKIPNYIPLPKDQARNVFPGLNLRQMVALNVGKVHQALFKENDINSVKMLCFDPKGSYFEQTKLTHFKTKAVRPEYFPRKYCFPQDPKPDCNNGKVTYSKCGDAPTCDEVIKEWDRENMGYMIVAVPPPEKQFSNWD